MQKRQPSRPAAAPSANGPDANHSQSSRTGAPPDAATGSSTENPLSEREMEVSRLLVTGATNTEIARELTISPHTVKVHLRNVFEKLQVSSRTEASMVLLQRGWVLVPGVETPQAPGRPAQEQFQAAPEIPEPPPLTAPRPEMAAWQRVYLSLALALCLVAAFAPFVLGRPSASFTLLSDAGRTVMGKPSVELLNRWNARAPLGQARSRMAVVMDQQRIYVLGGEGRNGRLLSTAEAYDLEDNQWLALPPLPYGLANSAATLAGDAIYLAGGTGPNSEHTGSEHTEQQPPALSLRDDLLRFDTAANEWQTVGVLPAPLAGAQLAAYQDTLYLLGGWDGVAMRDEVWALSLPAEISQDAGDWRVITRLPVPKAFFGATWVDGRLYVAGGYDGQKELDTLHVYRPDADAWRSLAPLSTPRGGLTLAYDGVALLALGGGWTRLISDHERYDATANQWTTFASPISGEWRHMAAVSRDGVIHLLGGWSGDYLDIHLQYQSSFRALLPIITSD